MTSNNGKFQMRNGTIAVLSTAAVMLGMTALTQAPVRSSVQTPISARALTLNIDDEQNGPPAPHFGQQGGGPGGRPGRGPGRPPLARIPASLLQSELNLTAEQAAKIAAIQKALPARTPPPPPSASDETGGPGAPDNNRNLERDASTKISALLTDDQKSNLSNVFRLMGALRIAGIPPEVVADLKLTSEQTTQLKALAPSGPPSEGNSNVDRRALHEKAMAILTDAQQKVAEQYRAAHPHQGPPPPDGGAGPENGGGGPGGPGGPTGADGPPPPGE